MFTEYRYGIHACDSHYQYMKQLVLNGIHHNNINYNEKMVGNPFATL